MGEAEGIAPAELQERLEKGLAAVSDRKLRMSYGTAVRSIRKEANFSQEYIDSAIEEKLSKVFASAFASEPVGEQAAVTGKRSVATKKTAAAASAKKTSPAKKKTVARKKK